MWKKDVWVEAGSDHDELSSSGTTWRLWRPVVIYGEKLLKLGEVGIVVAGDVRRRS